MKSSFLTLNWKDLLKGFVVAVLTAIITAILPILQAGAIPDWPTLSKCLIAGAAAGLAYIIKNIFTNSNDELLKPEKK